MHHNVDRRKNGASSFGAFATSVLTFVFGIALLLWPGIAQETIVLAASIILGIVGIISILHYFFRRGPYAFSDWSFGMGLLLLISSILLYFCRDILVPMLFTFFGIAVFIGGIVKIQFSLNARRYLTPNWFIPFCCAICSCVLGVLIILHPGAIADVLTQFIGASIIIETILDSSNYIMYRRLLKRIV